MRAIKPLLTATVTVAALFASASAHADACGIQQIGDNNQVICVVVDHTKLAAELLRQQARDDRSSASSSHSQSASTPQSHVGDVVSHYLPLSPLSAAYW